MRYQIQSYFKFLKHSTNQHGVHSPFVYQLVTNCFYLRKPYPEYQDLATYHQQLLNNNDLLHIKDLGPGSRKTTSKSRRIQEVAKTSGTRMSRAKLLFRLTRYFQWSSILELGTSLGIATKAMHLGNPNAQITTIEGSPELSTFTQSLFSNAPNVDFIVGDFSEELPLLTQSNFDAVFFDGNHTKKATLSYFEGLLPKAHNDTVFIFDDIYWSKEMTEAWSLIKNHPKVTISIDTFQWGFVFFRQEQAKEHFVIRI